MPSSCIPQARGRAPGHGATSQSSQLWCGSRFLWLGQPKDKFCSVVIKNEGSHRASLLHKHIFFFLGGEGEDKIWEVLVEYPVIQWCILVLICINLDDTPSFLFCSSIQVVWISLSLYLCHSVSLSLSHVCIFATLFHQIHLPILYILSSLSFSRCFSLSIFSRVVELFPLYWSVLPWRENQES